MRLLLMPPFHAGELEVQGRAGVRARASRVGGSIHREMPPAAADFLAQREFVILGAADVMGRPWASLLAGHPGFAHAIGPRSVRIDTMPSGGDPLAGHLAEGQVAGLLAIDLGTRRRMRVNGRLEPLPVGLMLHADQVYSNCPKYIHPRGVELGAGSQGSGRRSGGLSEAQRDRIRAADTFFIATVNPGEGADASHRGGPAGFVRVEGDRLVWPDYAGNMMYNTLGNIAAHPRAGLLFLDFTRGSRLWLTGTTRVDWDPEHAARVTGAERLVEMEVEEVVELEAAGGTV